MGKVILHVRCWILKKELWEISYQALKELDPWGAHLLRANRDPKNRLYIFALKFGLHEWLTLRRHNVECRLDYWCSLLQMQKW